MMMMMMMMIRREEKVIDDFRILFALQASIETCWVSNIWSEWWESRQYFSSLSMLINNCSALMSPTPLFNFERGECGLAEKMTLFASSQINSDKAQFQPHLWHLHESGKGSTWPNPHPCFEFIFANFPRNNDKNFRLKTFQDDQHHHHVPHYMIIIIISSTSLHYIPYRDFIFVSYIVISPI